MSQTDEGSPENLPDNTGASYSTRDCPFCGDTVKKLPDHLRHHCPETAEGSE